MHIHACMGCNVQVESHQAQNVKLHNQMKFLLIELDVLESRVDQFKDSYDASSPELLEQQAMMLGTLEEISQACETMRHGIELGRMTQA